MEKFKDVIDKLQQKKAMLEKRVDKIESNFRSVHSPDSEDRATESENDEVYEALNNAGRQELVMIDEAIKRFEKDQYGICVLCNNEIPIGRLQALPYATLCVECASTSS